MPANEEQSNTEQDQDDAEDAADRVWSMLQLRSEFLGVPLQLVADLLSGPRSVILVGMVIASADPVGWIAHRGQSPLQRRMANDKPL